MYPPLITNTHGGCGVEVFIVALHLVGVSSLAGSVNIICTALYARRSYFAFSLSSLMVYSVFITAVLLILVVPVLAGAITILLMDRSLNTVFFDVSSGGDVVLFQHLF